MTIYLPAEVLWTRVLSRTSPVGSCLVWEGATNSKGYGCIASGRKGKTVLTHRVAVMAAGRALPDHMTVDHLCANKLCVNPAHLEVVTRTENTRRGLVARGCRVRESA